MTRGDGERYSCGEEIANSIIHGVGIVLGIVALTLMTTFSVRFGDVRHLAASIVYGTSLVLLYTASTLYHAFPWPRVKRVFRVFDHTGIYVLIAGTYTPYTLITLRDAGGLALFGVIWGVAVLGVLAEAFWQSRPRLFSVTLYLVMGWLMVGVFDPLTRNLSATGVRLLFAGGMAYTLGVIFYALKRVPYMHAVWHGFVLAGSVCHFLSIMIAVVPHG